MDPAPRGRCPAVTQYLPFLAPNPPPWLKQHRPRGSQLQKPSVSRAAAEVTWSRPVLCTGSGKAPLVVKSPGHGSWGQRW